MAYFNRTYRIKDGERIEGSWRHIFIRNGSTYFLAVPEHLRLYLLGDQDAKDEPLRILLTPVGHALERGWAGQRGRIVKQTDHDATWDYFRRWSEEPRLPQTQATLRFDSRATVSYCAPRASLT